MKKRTAIAAPTPSSTGTPDGAPAPTAAQVEDWLFRLWNATRPRSGARGFTPDSDEYARFLDAGESPTPLFDPAFYARQLPWFARGQVDLLRHYLGIGWKQGLSPHLGFDAAHVARGLGVQAWTVPPLLAFFEAAAEVSAHPLFDLDIFSRRVDPVAFGLARCFEAFVGRWSKCRGPFSRWFGFHYYEAQEPVTRAGNVNPLLHYLDTPLERRRDPSPMVHNRWYDQQYPALAGEPLDPLIRFVTCGIACGHLPNPFAAAQLKCKEPLGLRNSALLKDYVDVSAVEARLAARSAAAADNAPERNRAVVVRIANAEGAKPAVDVDVAALAEPRALIAN